MENLIHFFFISSWSYNFSALMQPRYRLYTEQWDNHGRQDWVNCLICINGKFGSYRMFNCDIPMVIFTPPLKKKTIHSMWLQVLKLNLTVEKQLLILMNTYIWMWHQLVVHHYQLDNVFPIHRNFQGIIYLICTSRTKIGKSHQRNNDRAC